MKNTLFIVDDHSMLKNGLKNYLETNTDYVVTGTFADGTECLRKWEKTTYCTDSEKSARHASSCYKKGSTYYIESCVSGYHLSGNSCVAD